LCNKKRRVGGPSALAGRRTIRDHCALIQKKTDCMRCAATYAHTVAADISAVQ
jgi:hypothetical protein